MFYFNYISQTLTLEGDILKSFYTKQLKKTRSNEIFVDMFCSSNLHKVSLNDIIPEVLVMEVHDDVVSYE